MIWFAIAILTIAVLALLLRPLWRARRAEVGIRPEIAIYRDQLAELEAERARGLIADDAADTARLEIERRLLAVPDALPAAEQTPAQRRRLAGVLAVVAIAMAIGVYLELGRPDLADQPLAARDLPPADNAGPAPDLDAATRDALEAEAMQLEASLDENPSQRDVWAALGNRLIALGRYRAAIDAFDQAIAQGADDRLTQSRLGVSLTLLDGGRVSADAENAFRRALAADESDVAAAYWLAIRELQLGRTESALRQLVMLERQLPEEAPQRLSVGAVIDDVARSLGLDPVAARDALAGVPAMGEDAVPQGDDQEAFILSMVEGLAARLAENPDDLEGWRRLGRSWTVLGEFGKAMDAYGRAAELAPDDTEILLDYALAILATVPDGASGPLPPALGTTVDRVLLLSPDDPTGLYLAGLAHARAGDVGPATAYWKRLLAVLPADAPQRAQIEAELDALAGR